MSRDYMLICFNCKTYLSFGKVYEEDKNGNLLDDITFDGIFEDKTRRWHKRDEFFGRVMEKFLILHRNHELRFVPEGVDEMLEIVDGKVVDRSEEESILESPVVPGVDWWKEKEDWMNKFGIDD
ncbi:hypothetical protein [Synechococcus sp. PCC 7336]|uniref:hypothetical protein n=1 Tax=Synechococcus sp. PCC 7336 TaxID=195250 RepID=UPI000381FA9B|nr:hypothetical protein [Synechococcus sp. PCC 7336]